MEASFVFNLLNEIETSEDSEDEDLPVVEAFNNILLPEILADGGGGIFNGGLHDVFFQVLERKSRTAIPNYVEEVVSAYSDLEFLTHFRLRKGVVNDLETRLENTPIMLSLQGHGGPQALSAKKHLLVFLWFVGHQTASYRDVADRFNVSLSTLYEVISRVVKFFLNIAPTVIKYPTQEEKNITKEYFRPKGLHNVIGLIDGSHIRIDRPCEDKDAYVNRKKYFSIQMQGVVNEKGKFLDVFVGYPGSVHDARVFSNSPIARDLDEICQGGDYILGDSAYPCLPNLLTPYRDNGHLTRQQRHYNTVHSSCRIVVEHAFGWLKQRFRQLYHLKLRNMRRMVELIHVCCVLHNLADEDDLTHLEPPAMDNHPDAEVPIANQMDAFPILNDNDPSDNANGKQLRDGICQNLWLERTL